MYLSTQQVKDLHSKLDQQRAKLAKAKELGEENYGAEEWQVIIKVEQSLCCLENCLQEYTQSVDRRQKAEAALQYAKEELVKFKQVTENNNSAESRSAIDMLKLYAKHKCADLQFRVAQCKAVVDVAANTLFQQMSKYLDFLPQPIAKQLGFGVEQKSAAQASTIVIFTSELASMSSGIFFAITSYCYARHAQLQQEYNKLWQMHKKGEPELPSLQSLLTVAAGGMLTAYFAFYEAHNCSLINIDDATLTLALPWEEKPELVRRSGCNNVDASQIMCALEVKRNMRSGAFPPRQKIVIRLYYLHYILTAIHSLSQKENAQQLMAAAEYFYGLTENWADNIKGIRWLKEESKLLNQFKNLMQEIYDDCQVAINKQKYSQAALKAAQVAALNVPQDVGIFGVDYGPKGKVDSCSL